VADVAQNVRYGEEDMDFRIIFPASTREQPDYLKGLLIPNQQGHKSPWGAFPSWSRGPLHPLVRM
jgi:hypothetical protein